MSALSSIRDRLARGLDPVQLARSLKMTPDKWQADLLRSTHPRVILNCSRQSGKSTIIAVLALVWALYRPGSVVLIVSPTQRQSSEVFKKVLAFYRQLGRPIPPESENALSLGLENGSRVISAPATEGGIRTYSVDLLLLDEASRISDETFQAVAPMLATTGGRIVACSTPAGRRGWWYEATLSKRWKHVRIPATECPRIPADFLEEELESLGQAGFEQEYLCVFTDAAGAAFSSDDVDAIFGGSVPVRQVPSAARRRPTETELTALQMRRVEATMNGRIDARRREEARIQRLCHHRWRVSEAGRECCFCFKREENAC